MTDALMWFLAGMMVHNAMLEGLSRMREHKNEGVGKHE